MARLVADSSMGARANTPGRWANQSVYQSARPINRTINQSINQYIDQASNLPTYQEINLTCLPSPNHSGNPRAGGSTLGEVHGAPAQSGKKRIGWRAAGSVRIRTIRRAKRPTYNHIDNYDWAAQGRSRGIARWPIGRFKGPISGPCVESGSVSANEANRWVSGREGGWGPRTFCGKPARECRALDRPGAVRRRTCRATQPGEGPRRTDSPQRRPGRRRFRGALLTPSFRGWLF